MTKIDNRKTAIFVNVIKYTLHEIYAEIRFNGSLALGGINFTCMPYRSYRLERNKFAHVGQKNQLTVTSVGTRSCFLSNSDRKCRIKQVASTYVTLVGRHILFMRVVMVGLLPLHLILPCTVYEERRVCSLKDEYFSETRARAVYIFPVARA